MADSNSSNEPELWNFPHPLPRELPELAEALQARYPGVRIVRASLSAREDGMPQQNVRYQAPLDLLCEYGLVTQAMQRRKSITPIGDGFCLLPALDSFSVAGCHDLFIWTGAAPRESTRGGLSKAKQVLRKFVANHRGAHG